MKKSKGIKFNYVYLLIGLLILVLAFFTITKAEKLWNPSTWASIAVQFPEYGVMTLGVMLCFIAGCIDVSFVALADLSTVVGFMFMVKMTENGAENVGWIVLVGVLIALAVGALGGLLNGNLISRLGIPPIMATLATQMVFRGIAIGVTQGNPVTGIPELYSNIGHFSVLGFQPVPIIVFLIVFAIIGFLLRYTTYGRKLYMLGSNPKAARFSAINTTRMVNSTLVIAGVCAAIGGLLMVSTMNSAKADYGSSYLMRSILILVLAGVLPDGGMGKILNVLIAIVAIQIIATGVNMFPNLNTYYSNLISAVMLLVMLVATSRLLGERKTRKVTDKKELPKAES